MVLVYYAPDGSILWTAEMADGAEAPAGDHIEIEAAPTDLHLWRVEDGALVEREDAAELVLAEARANASLSPAAFFIAMKSGGVLTPMEAAQAAAGEMPASIAGVLAEMPEDTQAEVLIRFRRASQFDRLDPFLALFAQAMGISDAQFDALFGIGGAP